MLSALAGLRPTRARTRSWVGVGVVALLVGLALCWRGGRNGSETAVNGGVLLVVFGVGAATAPLLGLVSRLAGAAPLSLRLAARDAGRSRGRAGPATVAAMLGLAGAVGGSVMFQTAQAQANREYVALLGENQLKIEFTDTARQPTALEVDRLLEAAADTLAGAVGGRLDRLHPAGAIDEVIVAGGKERQSIDVPGGRVMAVAPPGSQVAVVDVATLGAMGASQARQAFESGHVVAVNGGTVDEGGTVTLSGISERQVEELATLPAVKVEGEALSGLANYLLSAATADALGLTTRPSAIVVRTPRPVTGADVRRVSLAALEAVPTVPVQAFREVGQIGAGRFVLPAMLGAGALVALFVVGLVTALSREELRPHLRTLAAAGAAARTRRRLAAAQSGLLAAMAGLLAIPAGLLPAVAILRSRSGDVQMVNALFARTDAAPLVVVPWLAIIALVLGVALAATLGGGMFTRTRPPGS